MNWIDIATISGTVIAIGGIIVAIVKYFISIHKRINSLEMELNNRKDHNDLIHKLELENASNKPFFNILQNFVSDTIAEKLNGKRKKK